MAAVERQFYMSEADEYLAKVNQPLTPSDSRPIDTQEEVDKINKQVFDKLADYHDRSATAGYFQSHPHDPIYTSHALALDEATLNNNYQRLIFGGQPDPVKDNIHMAYNRALRARAESTVARETTLENMNPLQFVPAEEATKDSVIETFAKTREYHKGQLDTDAERFMKSRAGHELTQVTYYGKNQGRFHYVAGQHAHLQFRPDSSNFKSWCNLSSRTYAPDGDGGEVPLVIQNQNGLDPRAVPLSHELRSVNPEPMGMFNLNDTGNYPGRDVDQYVQNYDNKNYLFEQLFSDQRQRRWV